MNKYQNNFSLHFFSKPTTFSSLQRVIEVEKSKGCQSQEEICKKFEIHPTQANLWKREFLANAAQLFDKENKHLELDAQEKKLQELYAQIGQLKVENDFLKKKLR